MVNKVNCIALICGVVVPLDLVQLSYGVASAPRCYITMPFSNAMRALPEEAPIAVFFQDVIQTEEKQILLTKNEEQSSTPYRLLFDGELESVTVSISPTGASLTYSLWHNASQLDLMPMTVMPVSQQLMNMQSKPMGVATLTTVMGESVEAMHALEWLYNKGCLPDKDGKAACSEMVDVAYLLYYMIMSSNKKTDNKYAALQYYLQKYSLIHMDNRFYGVNKNGALSPVLAKAEDWEPEQVNTFTPTYSLKQ